MTIGRSLAHLVLISLLSFAFVSAQSLSESQIFSPLTGETFHTIARRLLLSATPDSDRRALLFLKAATELQLTSRTLDEDILTIASRWPDNSRYDLVYQTLKNYTDDNSDFEILRNSARYLLGTADSRTDREQLLWKLYYRAGKANQFLASEVFTELAQLTAETGAADQARILYAQAYDFNRYNRHAFAQYDMLLQKENLGLNPEVYAINMRLAMDINPLDFDAAYTFAVYCEKTGVYDIAARAYEYAAGLFEYARPGDPLPASICLPWALTACSNIDTAAVCLDIAQRFRTSGRFDIRLEAIAATAAQKTGKTQLSREILNTAAKKAEQLLTAGDNSGEVTAIQLGWFYAFAQPNPEAALAWTNRAYSADPNNPDVRSMFAYALVANNQPELAETFAGQLHNDQIARLTMAMVLSAKGPKDDAISALRDVVAMDPLSLVAQKAQTLLAENGSQYTPNTIADTIRTRLTEEFGQNVVGLFTPPADMFSAKLDFGGSEFSFGSDIDAQLVIFNTSKRTIVVSDSGIFKGNIRVDADLRGDINRKLPALAAKRTLPSKQIGPGEYLSVDLDLTGGPLGEILFRCPQASLELEFTAWLDPLVDRNGDVRNTLPDIKPVRRTIRRRPLELTRELLMQHLNALETGQEGQKTRASDFFTALAAEQQQMSRTKPLYRYIQVENPIVIDAIKRTIADKNWKVRCHAIQNLTILPGKLDYKITSALSASLNDTNWPVRMMALYVLANNQPENFTQVLDWSAGHDAHILVREMATLLGGKPSTSASTETTP